MGRCGLVIGWAAAALSLSGCGETDPRPPASKLVGGGLTIELPEPKAPPAPPATAPVLAEEKAEAEPPVTKIEKIPAPVPEAPPIAPKPPVPEAERAAEPSPEADTGRRSGDASLPLPGAVVARTIERIGYPCGGIASSARIKGAAGETAYRITCTSGDTYRANNKSGRFRFRKWSDSGE
jgi:outer membrane biosynthesis protein TonB